MKSLKSVISFLGVLSFVFCSQVAVAQKSGGGNAIPYPLGEWKGVQGNKGNRRRAQLFSPPRFWSGKKGAC